jgi:ankyrin repeat protein
MKYFNRFGLPSYTSRNVDNLLHFICRHKIIILESTLEKNSADINKSNLQGVYPIHEAARYGDLSSVLLMIKFGADIRVNTNEGKTILDYLIEYSNNANDFLKLFPNFDINSI